jgi:succinyl-CoA synthetase alpha subunit
MVGGVTPKKGGTTHLGLPVFNTVEEVSSFSICCAWSIFYIFIFRPRKKQTVTLL